MVRSMELMPSWLALTPARKRLLELLSDGKWHRKFPGIGLGTYDMMQILGFVRQRFVDKKPEKTGNWFVEARITLKGRFLLKHGQCNLRYGQGPRWKITVVEMEKRPARRSPSKVEDPSLSCSWR